MIDGLDTRVWVRRTEPELRRLAREARESERSAWERLLPLLLRMDQGDERERLEDLWLEAVEARRLAELRAA